MLLKTIDDIKAYVAVNSGLEMVTISPTIKAAERNYIVPVIGRQLYQLMDEAYSINALTPQEQALLPYLQNPIAQLAIYLYIPQAELQISDGGITRTETTNTKTAYKQQVAALRESLLDGAFAAIETLLDYLEGHQVDFPLWTDSDERADMNSLLVRSGREMKRYCSSINQPQRTYLATASMMHTIEDITIQELIGDTFGELKAKQAAGTLSALDKTVVDHLKKAVANLTMCKAMLQLEMRVDASNGVTIVGTKVDTTRGDDSNRQTAEMRRVDALASQYDAVGQAYIDLAQKTLTLNASPTVFPTWYGRLQAAAAAVNTTTEDANQYLNASFGL